MSHNVKDFLKPDVRVCVPVYERIKQLYAYGYSNALICETVNTEFQDVDPSPTSAHSVRTIIRENQAEMEKAKLQYGIKCRDEIERQIELLFRATEDVEVLMVSVYVNKLRDVLKSLAELDLEELTEEGGYKNTSRIFVLIELAEKFQSKIAKIVGTDALREIEVFRKKAEAKQNAENNKGGMIPPPIEVNGKDVTPQTTFIT